MSRSFAICRMAFLLQVLYASGHALPPDGGKAASKPDYSKLPPLTPKMEAWFKDQVGSVWDFDPKGPVARLMAQVLKDGFPTDRKAKWIDDLPAIKPMKPDILPVLPAKTLHFDAAAVNAHWPVFQRRNPQCAAYLKKVGITPVMDAMPGEDFASYASQWVTQHDLCFEKDSAKYFQALGCGLLYVDFLSSRGGEQGKKDAVKLLTWVAFALGIQPKKQLKEDTLAAFVAKEITWPLLDPGKGLWNEMLSRDSSIAFKDAKLEQDNLNYDKWMLLNAPCPDSYKDWLLLKRCNAYSQAKDDTGVILMLHSVYSDGSYDKILNWMHTCFVRKYGKKQGEILYRLYLKAVYEEKKHPVVAKALGLIVSPSPTENEVHNGKKP